MENKRWWSKEKIEWYERAAAYSDFHRTLASEIEPYIDMEDSILELGCGLGHVAEILNGHHYSISAIDRDQEVIERARKRSGLDIFSVSDYQEYKEKGDVVLTIFFGRLWVDDNLSALLSLSNKALFSIHSLHSGQDGNLISRYTPDLETSLSFLTNKGLKAEGKVLSIPFHQPLKDEKEAQAFIRASYPNGKEEDYLKYLESSGIDEFPIMLPNYKKMVMLWIEKPMI